MIVRSRTLVTMESPVIEDGAVVLENGRILASGAFRDIRNHHSTREVVDLGEQVLLPGLINAHCHLDYTVFKGAISRGLSFTRWVAKINALKRSLDDDTLLHSISSGFAELKKWGTTTVLNIESFPELMWRMPPPPIRTWWFYEMIDIRHREPTREAVSGALRFFEHNPEWQGGFGLSPHAPYTASASLYRHSGTCAAALNLPLTTHVAESPEEMEMFQRASGPMAEFLHSLGRPMDDCGGTTPLSHLVRNHLIDRRWILVHLNELTETDFRSIADEPLLHPMHVVHCPQSHRFFNHRSFPLQRLRDLGVNISLGTDSLASGDSLSLFEEMRLVNQTFPALLPHEILEMVTVNPARALQQKGHTGTLSAGSCADMIAIPFNDGTDRVYDAILHNPGPVRWMMINGHIPS